ncbi:MAG: cyclase family protein [Spirochaetaceae bacterium]|nr:MAG: cyclase family protein [Spirochaetaceae bacterium]
MRVIDLSQPIFSGMPVYPGDPEVRIDTAHTYDTHGWLLRSLSLGSHTGTHLDAPSHMHADGATISQVLLERCMGDAVATEPGAEYPFGAGLLFTDRITESEFSRIAEARPPFVGGDMDEALERRLLAEGIFTYTGLVNLNELPRHQTFTFIGLPLPIADGDGSPVRAVAIIEDTN